MERLLKLFLSIAVAFSALSCDSKRERAEAVYKRAIHYPQGSMMSINGIKRATEIDSTYDEAVRELSVAYLKRGLPHKWKPQIDKAIECAPSLWQGYRGYNYLWFYRDYKKAIADFDATDSLTPNFIDAPQGHSVDYWRGICYLGLKDYKNSIAYFDKYINTEIEESGEDWVEVTAFLYRGIAYFETENYDQALLNFEKQLQYSRNQSADAKYYKALIFKFQGRIKEAMVLIEEAINDYNIGYYNNRPYVETLRQIYPEDLDAFRSNLK
ncbi:tetratricopeptide repeat protein [Psychroserpens sp.]|uniref:tetratricopeptide repeat protein n=1 Tax=Psychroserpens sp. TaxID=2020870 RepID=UPI002B276047|nr:tetratricopeptide repeat protein [Psychroserpens sp.]